MVRTAEALALTEAGRPSRNAYAAALAALRSRRAADEDEPAVPTAAKVSAEGDIPW